MKLVTLFLVLFSITHCDVYAQDTKPLKKQLSAAKEDTTRIRLLNNIADIYYNNYEYDSCKEYATQALNLSIRLENNISANKNADYALLCKKLKAKSIENYGSSIMYENSNASVDSVEIAAKYWNETGDKKGIASVYQRLGEVYTNQNNFTNALKYYNLSINLFKGLGNEAAVAFLYYDISLTQRYMANYGDALESGILSLEMFKKTKDTLLIIQCLLANGFTYMLAKDYKEALKTQQAGLNMAIAFKDSEYIATSYSDMGNTHKRSGNLSAALNDYTTAFNIRKKLNSSFYLSSNLLYIADILAKQEKYQESLAKDFESLQYAKQQKDGRYILDVYYGIAENYTAIHDYKNAFLYYDTLLQVSTKIKDNFRRSLSMQGMANIYLMQNKIQPAIDYLQKALIFTDTDDYRNNVEVYKGLSTAYEKKGDYKNAFESLRQYKRYSDSVEAHEKTLKLTSLTNQLEFQNKRALLKASQDKQLAIQQNQIKQQKLLRNITNAGLIIVIVFAFIFFIRFREKRKLNIQLEETVVNLKSTQKQLIQSEKMASLGELTAGIAHEIQNPLNFVINFSGVSNELIEDYKKEQSKPEETRDQELENEILEDIKSNLEKINHHGKRA
ncbi:MAG: tetratricopeptide repeat protein, partial [Bacteroidetes bacterium]|nr:tetratricopeptide repeat protein [Bacteroidota bacterium]